MRRNRDQPKRLDELSIKRDQNLLLTEHAKLYRRILTNACMNDGTDLYSLINTTINSDSTNPANLNHRRLVRVLYQGDLYNSVDALIDFLSKHEVNNIEGNTSLKIRTSGFDEPYELQTQAIDGLQHLKDSLESGNLTTLVEELFVVINQYNKLSGGGIQKNNRDYDRANMQQRMSGYTSFLSSTILVCGIGAKISEQFFDILPEGIDLIIDSSVIVSLISYIGSWYIFQNAKLTEEVIRTRSGEF